MFVRIVPVDPQCDAALALLREAAIEARELYPQLHVEGAPWPTKVALIVYTPSRLRPGEPCGLQHRFGVLNAAVHRMQYN